MIVDSTLLSCPRASTADFKVIPFLSRGCIFELSNRHAIIFGVAHSWRVTFQYRCLLFVVVVFFLSSPEFQAIPNVQLQNPNNSLIPLANNNNSLSFSVLVTSPVLESRRRLRAPPLKQRGGPPT